MAATGVLDDALDELGDRAPEYGGGLSNHGPMAVEALVHLGRADAVPAWSAWYARRLEPFTTAAVDRPAVLGELDEVAHGADERLLAVALVLVGRMGPAAGA